MKRKVNSLSSGNSLVFPWVRLCTLSAASLSLIPRHGTQFHMPQLGICMQQLMNPQASTKMEYPMCHKYELVQPNKYIFLKKNSSSAVS